MKLIFQDYITENSVGSQTYLDIQIFTAIKIGFRQPMTNINIITNPKKERDEEDKSMLQNISSCMVLYFIFLLIFILDSQHIY